MKKNINKKKTIYDKIYEKIIEYRQTLITTVIIMIPIVFILYILNIHNYIFPKLLGYNVIFRLDIYYKYFAFILIAIYFYEIIYKKEKPTLSDIFMYLFIIMTIISTIFAYDQKIALYGYPNRYEGMYTLLFYSFLYLNCKKITDYAYVKKMLKIIICVSFIHFFVVILQLTGLFSKVIFMYKSGDAIGLTENCNFLGSLMCLICMLTSGYYILKIDKKNYLYLVSFIVSYTTLLLANSTGPFISFIITFAIFIIYCLFKKNKNFKNMIVIIVIIIALYPVVLSNKDKITPEIKSHISYIIDKFKNEEKSLNSNLENKDNNKLSINQLGNGRIRIWKNVWKNIQEKSLIGYGPDNLRLVYQKSAGDSAYADKAHNIYLHIWVSSGIFALIGYIGFVIINIAKSLNNNNNRLVILLAYGIIAYSIQGMFNINVSEVTPYFYIIMGFMIGLINPKTVEKI